LIDDVSDSAVARWLLPGTGRSSVLIASRRRLVALEATHHLDVGPFSDREAVALLARMIGDRRVEAERAAANLIAARCGGLPQAIRVAGTRLRLHPQFSLEDIEAILDLPGRKAEQLLDVMMEVHAAAATGDGRFEMPRWLHAYLAHPDEDERG